MSRSAADRPREPLGPGDRLPRIASPRAPGGETVPWRAPPRGAPVVVFVHDSDCRGCRDYLASLAAAADDFEVWDGRPLVVAPAADRARAVDLADTVPFPVLVDPAGDARRRCGVPDGAAAVFVADRWGVVYHAALARTDHALPPPDRVVEWLKYLATQCAECGVPDEPGYGRWAP